MPRKKIKSLMSNNKLSTDQAVDATNSDVITSDELFNYFEYGEHI